MVVNATFFARVPHSLGRPVGCEGRHSRTEEAGQCYEVSAYCCCGWSSAGR